MEIFFVSARPRRQMDLMDRILTREIALEKRKKKTISCEFVAG